ncbi:hypothetical protein ACTMTI_50525 [Nonomuraea sp. H19]|uniref:hypothetical protein n=1 Tax=Nonomuraea sp. H19 TaxID=3452206 RepID=UPI003F8C2186
MDTGVADVEADEVITLLRWHLLGEQSDRFPRILMVCLGGPMGSGMDGHDGGVADSGGQELNLAGLGSEPLRESLAALPDFTNVTVLASPLGS